MISPAPTNTVEGNTLGDASAAAMDVKSDTAHTRVFMIRLERIPEVSYGSSREANVVIELTTGRAFSRDFGVMRVG